MKKKEKRYHRVVGDKVASVFIKEVYLPKTKTYADEYDVINVNYYEYIGACVSSNKRTNNDWWNGDKRGNKLHNRSTGNVRTFATVIDVLTKHVNAFINEYGYYCCMVDATDERRMLTYIKTVRHYAKKHKLTLTMVATDDGLVCLFEQ